MKDLKMDVRIMRLIVLVWGKECLGSTENGDITSSMKDMV